MFKMPDYAKSKSRTSPNHTALTADHRDPSPDEAPIPGESPVPGGPPTPADPPGVPPSPVAQQPS